MVLAGNNLAACHVLDLLVGALPVDQLLAIAPTGSARHTWQHSLASHAEERGVECLQPEDLNSEESVAAVRQFGGELLVSVYYTQIFHEPLLEAIGGPAINVHPSLLPRHRGFAPLIWAIAEGDRKTGLSIQLIDQGVDTGALLLQRSMPVHAEDTGYDLHLKMANLVRGSTARILRRFLEDRSLPEPRLQAGQATYHSASDPPLNHLSYDQPRARIRNIVRALAPPLPGAFSYVGPERITLARVTEVPESAIGAPRAPGMLQRTAAEELVVWAADGALRIDELVVRDQRLRGPEIPREPMLYEGVVLS